MEDSPPIQWTIHAVEMRYQRAMLWSQFLPALIFAGLAWLFWPGPVASSIVALVSMAIASLCGVAFLWFGFQSVKYCVGLCREFAHLLADRAVQPSAVMIRSRAMFFSLPEEARSKQSFSCLRAIHAKLLDEDVPAQLLMLSIGDTGEMEFVLFHAGQMLTRVGSSNLEFLSSPPSPNPLNPMSSHAWVRNVNAMEIEGSWADVAAELYSSLVAQELAATAPSSALSLPARRI